jgi:hypothetical protein
MLSAPPAFELSKPTVRVSWFALDKASMWIHLELIAIPRSRQRRRPGVIIKCPLAKDLGKRA